MGPCSTASSRRTASRRKWSAWWRHDSGRCERTHFLERRLLFRTRAHASSVAPVVLTSSTSTTIAAGMRDSRRPARETAKASRTLRCRCAAGSPVCAAVARIRRRAARTGTPRWRARSAAWLKPRSRRREGCKRTGTAKSAPARMPAPLLPHQGRQRPRERTAGRRISAHGRSAKRAVVGADRACAIHEAARAAASGADAPADG